MSYIPGETDASHAAATAYHTASRETRCADVEYFKRGLTGLEVDAFWARVSALRDATDWTRGWEPVGELTVSGPTGLSDVRINLLDHVSAQTLLDILNDALDYMESVEPREHPGKIWDETELMETVGLE